MDQHLSQELPHMISTLFSTENLCPPASPAVGTFYLGPVSRDLSLFPSSPKFKLGFDFSLDPPDGDMSYHPFNLMRFGPSRMWSSLMVHTMFETDYILKSLTVGVEIQRIGNRVEEATEAAEAEVSEGGNAPDKGLYAMRDLRPLIESLPSPLKVSLSWVWEHDECSKEHLHRARAGSFRRPISGPLLLGLRYFDPPPNPFDKHFTCSRGGGLASNPFPRGRK